MHHSEHQEPGGTGPAFQQRRATWIIGGILLLFTIGVFLFAPERLPEFKQRILGMLSAVLAGLLGYFLTGTLEVAGRLPGRLGGLGLRAAGGTAIFALVLFWWGSSIAPVRATDRDYQVRVFPVGTDGRFVPESELHSSLGGEILRMGDGWLLKLPASQRGREVNLSVEQTGSFLSGTATLMLAEDLQPTVQVRLSHQSASTVRGVVVDSQGQPLKGAQVSVAGTPTTVLTQESGSFVLEVQAADGEQVRLRARKEGFRPTDLWHPTGTLPATLVLSKDENR